MINPYQPPAAALMPGAGPSGGEYELGPQESAVVERTAKLSTAWGIISIVAGALFLLAMIGGLIPVVALLDTPNERESAILLLLFLAVGLGPFAAVHIVMGFRYVGAGKALRGAVETTGRDVAHLMGGLERLGGAFRVEAIFLVGTAALVILFYVGAVVLLVLTGGTA
jgi:nitrate reductase NapE component